MGLKPYATCGAIEAAYQKLAQIYYEQELLHVRSQKLIKHLPRVQRQWREITRAYKTLKDPQKRKEIDKAIASAAKAELDKILAAETAKTEAQNKKPAGPKPQVWAAGFEPRGFKST